MMIILLLLLLMVMMSSKDRETELNFPGRNECPALCLSVMPGVGTEGYGTPVVPGWRDGDRRGGGRDGGGRKSVG